MIGLPCFRLPVLCKTSWRNHAFQFALRCSCDNLVEVFDFDRSTFPGVLHGRCNTGSGFLNDSETLCLKAAAYLRGAHVES